MITKEQIRQKTTKEGLMGQYWYTGNGLQAMTSAWDNVMTIYDNTGKESVSTEYSDVSNKKDFVNKLYKYMKRKAYS